MRVPVVPFLTPPTDTVSHAGWTWTTPDREDDLPAEMPYWDYQTRLLLHTNITVRRDPLLEACALGPRSALAVVVLATSNHTRTEHLVARVPVPTRDPADITVQADLPGIDLGGQLTLLTQLVAVEPHPLTDLAARHTGAVLWQHRQRTQLEGSGAQFPTDSSDFAVTHPHAPHAGWELRIDLADPEAPFMSAVRLTLNLGKPAVVAVMTGARDPATARLLTVLNWDVTRQLVQAALACEEVGTLEVDPDALSLAGVLRNVLATVWPHDSVTTLRTWAAENPSRIETRLQSHCGVVP